MPIALAIKNMAIPTTDRPATKGHSRAAATTTAMTNNKFNTTSLMAFRLQKL